MTHTTTPRPIPNVTQILTVSELNSAARHCLETTFSTTWIIGEISNLAQPSSGHCYFSLKDERAQVRCALFRQQLRRINITPQNGQQVIARAQVTLYEPRGDYQLVIDYMEPAGIGQLQLAFEALKQRLSAAGLFNEEHKKALPLFPKQVGIITSTTGAAIRDSVKVLRRRCPLLPVIIYHTMVQGDQAAMQIVQAIETANRRQECDVLILCRGGGSLEDLWPFNEEVVARAIFNSQLPIVTGVGHETDFTIADFVADQRAATPSAAAELISPDKREWEQTLTQHCNTIKKIMCQQLNEKTVELRHLTKRLRHPTQRIREQQQTIDGLDNQLLRAITVQLSQHQTDLRYLQSKLLSKTPEIRIRETQLKLKHFTQQLYTLIRHNLEETQNDLNSLAHSLDNNSPLKILKRGYAIVTDESEQHVIRDVKQVHPGDRVLTTIAKGKLLCNVLSVKNET